MQTNITFRSHLIGEISDFCNNIALPIFSNSIHLVELIVLLSRYREEGMKLSPQIYFTNNVNVLLSRLPDSEKIKIGVTSCDSLGIKCLLKKCAPLAKNGWHIYAQNDVVSIEYGLFRGQLNPIAVLVDDVLLTKDDELKVVKAFQVAEDCVEVRANNDSCHYVYLDHRKSDTPHPLYYLDHLVRDIVSNVSEELREPTETLLKRIFYESLRLAHGCIVAVTSKKVPSFIAKDGIILDSSIDFQDLVKSYRKDSEQYSNIVSKSSLVSGMLNTDGIVLFNTNGKLLGYNFFIKTFSNKSIIGGARKRAFFALKNKIGKGIVSVLMQSQDGYIDFTRCKDE